MAELRDLSMDQGTTWNPTFILRNPDKSYFNLTGYEARLQVRTSFDGDAVLSLTTTNGKLVVQANGRIMLNVLPTDTSVIDFTGEAFVGVYDLEVESASDVVTRVASGSFTITREVTR